LLESLFRQTSKAEREFGMELFGPYSPFARARGCSPSEMDEILEGAKLGILVAQSASGWVNRGAIGVAFTREAFAANWADDTVSAP
jgi:hypothetical protein